MSLFWWTGSIFFQILINSKKVFKQQSCSLWSLVTNDLTSNLVTKLIEEKKIKVVISNRWQQAFLRSVFNLACTLLGTTSQQRAIYFLKSAFWHILRNATTNKWHINIQVRKWYCIPDRATSLLLTIFLWLAILAALYPYLKIFITSS